MPWSSDAAFVCRAFAEEPGLVSGTALATYGTRARRCACARGRPQMQCDAAKKIDAGMRKTMAGSAVVPQSHVRRFVAFGPHPCTCREPLGSPAKPDASRRRVLEAGSSHPQHSLMQSRARPRE